ncbi:conserved hypothetical protein [Formosa agariphila KMM 3901]|uniref:Glutamyl-tRNA synthetase n=1 Tax=Formosa agariphila (strain DSM 15362 / KCTC 12365 / LMG 23005 / KMM 3901 / M-2Alg 35-1) TaxID=1347342 RepID=T2KQY1_FORAG|nr:glutamyl-tRNA synthetase [Formosa agariphila]CDF81247.1 conserved hypothetical protein [Formosa agariphila KMM 3901]
MDNYKTIIQKLEGFIRRYYTNELIKGGILFFSIGLLYFLLTLLVEHFLWLSPTARAILFWMFVLVEVLLFAKFIVLPLSKLFKLQKGIDYEEASKLIGNHFPEVNDKLLNVLQLHNDSSKSELLLASINQKASELSPVPFKLAVNFNQNLKYLKYAILPVCLLLIFLALGKINWFTDSYKRVVDYKTAYEPPAPFQFFVLNENLNGVENKDFKLHINTAGSVIPEQAEIIFNNETYILQDLGSGEFEYVFNKPKTDITFQLHANGVTSKPYKLAIVEVPTLLGFDMVLEYPNYINKKDEVLKSTGNAIVPEGTKVTWKLNTKGTDQVHLFATDTMAFSKVGNSFEGSKQVYSNFNYSLSTSNKNLTNYESLNFSIDVIKDQFPELKVEMVKDTVDLKTMYFKGQVSDDYGLRNLNLVYFETDNESAKSTIPIAISKFNVDQFVTAFPNQLQLKEGVSYSLYFEVFDNDQLHGYKRKKSKVFSYREKTKSETKNTLLQQQQSGIQDFNNSLEKFDENQKMLDDISKTRKTKKTLNFNDRNQIKDVLKRQEQQEKMMKNFNKSFQKNLEEFDKDNTADPLKEELQKRLKENEEQLKQDERLLKELEKIQDKISEEELSEKFKYLSKQNKRQKRSLEQLVELTKRFYIAKKMEKLQEDLNTLGDEQLKQADKPKDKNTADMQSDLNKEFNTLQKELDALQKDNKLLKKPIELPRDQKSEEAVDQLQKDAEQDLKESESGDQSPNEQQKKENKAKQKQKQAGQKMKEMSKSMQQSMQMDGGEQMQEDAEMLRQILDNLLIFSFDEEALMNEFKSIEINHNNYAQKLRKQHDLREYFEHVDDSLFSLSLRQPMLSESINNEITEVYFYLDKSLEEFSENEIYQGVSSQQHVFSSANVLADLLSNILDNMEDQLNASSSGQGSEGKKSGESEGQLQDIIMSQEELNKQMQKNMSGEGSQSGQKKGQKDEPGANGKPDSKGNQGDGKKGDEQGKDGQQSNGQESQEGMSGELFSIYQRQQELRNELKERLQKEGLTPEIYRLLKDMESVEMDLLNDGFTQKTLEKMLNFEHQLLKLNDATFQQDQENKRESKSNSNSFSKTSTDKLPQAKQYFNTTEILNRQILPLQNSFKHKVQQYFKNE